MEYGRLKWWAVLFAMLIIQAPAGDKRNWTAIKSWAAELPAAFQLEPEQAEAEKQQQDKIDARKAKEESTGKKPRGRKPKSAEEAGNKDAKANVTDPDSRIMKTRKGFVQGLNAQAVTTEQQIIVAEDVTQEENDKQQLHPRCLSRPKKIDRPLK